MIQPFLHARLDATGSRLSVGEAGGIASLLRSLGTDMGFVPLVIGGCAVMFVLTLIFSQGNIGTGGLFSFLSPSPRASVAATTAVARAATSASSARRMSGTAGGLLQGLLGVVARAHERARRHRVEAHRVRLALELG